MEDSEYLFSSMSPKISTIPRKPLSSNKPPTFLALKKPMRRSSLHRASLRPKTIIIDDTLDSEKENGTIVEISDSDTDDISTIYGKIDSPFFKTPGTHFSVQSTFCHTNSPRFDEIFPKKYSTPINRIKLDCEKALTSNEKAAERPVAKVLAKTPAKAMHKSKVDDLLDSLYGNQWRSGGSNAPPMSEPQLKTKNRDLVGAPSQSKTCAKVLKNGRCPLLSNDVKRTAKCSDKLPSLLKTVKAICDSDSEDDILPTVKPKKLNFDDLENENVLPRSTPKKTIESNAKGTSKKNFASKKFEAKLPTGATPTLDKKVTFLESLADNIKIDQCHPLAVPFRTRYKHTKEQLAAYLFKLFNEKIFCNGIPSTTPLLWNCRLRKSAGYCACRKVTRNKEIVEWSVTRIELSVKILDSCERLRDTLIHEMCHAATWCITKVKDGHGPYWKSWTRKAVETFPELPIMKCCHNYQIQRKYIYRCVSCGYSVGRHSKSIDTKRKCCGYCKGTFELLMNQKQKNGEICMVPVTEGRPLNGFAKFVKENYAAHKAPDLKHADVMKLLGQKFSALKM